MQVNKHRIDIVFPSNLPEISARALQLCELFIGNVISFKFEILEISVDESERSVKCKNEKIKHFFHLILGAKKFKEFVVQMTSLLHVSHDHEALGDLICLDQDEIKRYSFYKNGKADLDWKIIPVVPSDNEYSGFV